MSHWAGSALYQANMQNMMAGLALVMVAAGCGVELGDDEPTTDPVARKECPDYGCGGQNSPNIAGTYFHELNMTSSLSHLVPNREGVALVSFTQAGVAYDLHVAHGRLVGTANGQNTIRGGQLQGAIFVVRIGSATSFQDYHIKIDEVHDEVLYWAKGGDAPALEGYRLKYQRINDTSFQDMCTRPPAIGGPDVLSMGGDFIHDVLVFEGERIDGRTRTDAADPTHEWFSIGCAGGTLAKMYLTGHTLVATLDGFSTTQAERQAILKMFSADYCGDGTPFTVSGQPLQWADDHKWMNADSSEITKQSSFEARWTDTGAACLSTPRATIAGTPANVELGQGVVDDIASTCAAVGHRLRPCSDTNYDGNSYPFDGYHLLSVNP